MAHVKDEQVWNVFTGRRQLADHEALTHVAIARRLADLRKATYCGVLTDDTFGDALYLVPDDTLLPSDLAAFGAAASLDFFGGSVPFPFVMTKAITHATIAGAQTVPTGWSETLGECLRESVLNGYSAFCAADAHRAGLSLLSAGALRLKPLQERGGVGQKVIEDRSALAPALDAIDFEVTGGIVLEQNLTEVETFSVGFISMGSAMISYVGTQELTSNNHDLLVYGGSDLFVARGCVENLLAQTLDGDRRRAIELSVAYERAAFSAYPDITATRRNYDVAKGRDNTGKICWGVLEQSWRLGGASAAEALALQALSQKPARATVRARCCERYGNDLAIPANAEVFYQDGDSKVGPMAKYALIPE